MAATRAATGDGSSPLPDSLDVDDQFITSAAESPGRALADVAPGIYTDSVAQAIAAHVLYVARRRAPITTHHRQG